jgi:hypothetical protein
VLSIRVPGNFSSGVWDITLPCAAGGTGGVGVPPVLLGLLAGSSGPSHAAGTTGGVKRPLLCWDYWWGPPPSPVLLLGLLAVSIAPPLCCWDMQAGVKRGVAGDVLEPLKWRLD